MSTADLRIRSIDLDSYRKGWDDGELRKPTCAPNVTYYLGYMAGKYARENVVGFWPLVVL